MIKLVSLGQVYSLDIPSEKAFLSLPECPSGYNLNPITNTCTPIQVTSVFSPTPITPITSINTTGITCPMGFTLNPATGICIPSAPQTSEQPIIDAMQKYMPYLLIGGFAITAIIIFKSMQK